MRIFKNKAFHRWAKDVDLSDHELKTAVVEISNGSYEANLGGNIYKKRIALEGRGKRSGARTIVAFKAHKSTFFIYGFAKNVRSSISEKEESALKMLAKIYFGYSDEQLLQAVKAGQLFEVK